MDKFLFLNIFLLVVSASCTYIPKKIAQISIKYPAFASFIPNRNDSTKYHLAVSAFDAVPYSSDYVYYFKNYDGVNLEVQRLDDKNLVWPNEAIYVDESIFESKTDLYGGLVVAGGFLVPTKSNGGLYYYPFSSFDRSTVSTVSPIVLTSNPKDPISWFYHRPRYVDLNADGLKDFLTCRTHKPIIGATLTQLVGLIYNQNTKSYNLTVIANEACDIFFDVADVDRDGRFEIIASGFFISKLNVIYSDDSKNSFVNGNAKVMTIDENSGKLFDIGIYNLDNTGNLELLITNHQGNNDKIKGAIFYYQLNGNIRTGTWTKNIIYDNFPVLKPGSTQAAPGGAKAFLPTSVDKIPYILLSGDGSEYAYLFEPVISTTSKLSYNLVWSQYYKGDTVGAVACADINNDGYTECVIPIYESNFIDVFTMTKK